MDSEQELEKKKKELEEILRLEQQKAQVLKKLLDAARQKATEDLNKNLN